MHLCVDRRWSRAKAEVSRRPFYPRGNDLHKGAALGAAAGDVAGEVVAALLAVAGRDAAAIQPPKQRCWNRQRHKRNPQGQHDLADGTVQRQAGLPHRLREGAHLPNQRLSIFDGEWSERDRPRNPRWPAGADQWSGRPGKRQRSAPDRRRRCVARIQAPMPARAAVNQQGHKDQDARHPSTVP